MCGIAGVLSREPLSDEARRCVGEMSARLVHRGPDGSGDFHDAHVHLAVQRLAIFDPAGGMQPLYNEDRSLVLLANAAIYNHIELRARLEGRGHRFGTRSDCEAILHLYEEHGADCVEHLRGMFAFALWDQRRRRLLLARDRLGEKPLYLVEQPGRWVFASELKALVAAGVVPFDLDPASINLFFHYQFIPEPATALRGVRKLRAGHLLVLDLDRWQATEKNYWRLEQAPPLEGHPPQLIRRELERVAELVIRADVPVGLALSGGIDSSTIAALVQRRNPGGLEAFCVGYPGRPACDERREAGALASHLKMALHEVEVTTSDVVDGFADLVHRRDDPIADISGHGYYAVMQHARRHDVRVMLQGQGGDELFWGYPWVREAVHASQRKAAQAAQAAQPAQPAGRWRLGNLWRRFRADPNHIASSPADRLMFYDLHPDFQSAFNEMPAWYTPEFQMRLGGHRADDVFRLPRPWTRLDLVINRLIIETYLRENGITQAERLSMAAGVELRLPFLDHRLVETVIGLRKTYPDDRLAAKAWLREAVRDLLPPWALDRPKRGFNPPAAEWYSALFARHGSDLADGYLVQAGVLRPDRAGRRCRQPTIPGTVTPVAFKALVLEQWCRAFSSLATPRAERLDQVVREGTLKPASQARSPIVMFVYRRPEHTLRTLESLSRDPLALGSDLHIYCDGPRSGSEDEAVNEVRRVIRRRPWCGRVTIREREENLGLAASVMAGVSEMLERHESIIVLEDDLELSPRFLEYMNSALERYRHEARVMQISGYMFPTAVGEQGEAGFLPMISSWGWGTWRRAWQHFDPTLTSWEMLLGDKELQHRFDLEGSFPFTWLLRELLAGRTDSWAIRWYLSVFRQQGLTLFPARSYVHNFGWDGSGTNCPPSPVYKTEVSLEPVRDFPETIAITPALHAGVKKFLGKYHPQRRPGVVRRMFGRLRQLLRAKG